MRTNQLIPTYKCGCVMRIWVKSTALSAIAWVTRRGLWGPHHSVKFMGYLTQSEVYGVPITG